MTRFSTRDSREVFALARRQHGVVTYQQLRELDLSPEAIDHRSEIGRLHAVHHGVYAVGRPDLTREGKWLAAVLSCGDVGLLCDTPGGLLWGILESGNERPQVLVPGGSGMAERPGMRVHTSTILRPQDASTFRGIPVTSPARTVFDLASHLGPAALKAAVRQAVRLDLATLEDLAELAPIGHRERRAGRLRRVLDGYIPREELTQSELEARFVELCARRHLPMPQMQRRAGRYRSDFVWEEFRVVVETDGRRDHATVLGMADDRAKDRALVAAGYVVLRFTWAEVVNDPATVARELKAIFAQRRRAK
jgi:very-short-patch-repair endonuclease